MANTNMGFGNIMCSIQKYADSVKPQSSNNGGPDCNGLNMTYAQQIHAGFIKPYAEYRQSYTDALAYHGGDEPQASSSIETYGYAIDNVHLQTYAEAQRSGR